MTAADAAPQTFCERCGQPERMGAHATCRQALELEPARYCRQCARRMIVQVTPAGWSARCVEHGTRVSSAS